MEVAARGLLVIGLFIVPSILSKAALLGFSATIGGFFSGLIFSGDPLSVKIDASFDSVHDLFVPFFFIFVGFSIDLPVLAGLLGPVLLLLLVAVLGMIVTDP